MRLWYTRARIPNDLRSQFEAYGEPVVAQILGRPYTHQAWPVTPGVPLRAGTVESRRHGHAWLREQHEKEGARRTISEVMEIAIVILVAIEVLQHR